MGKNWLAHRLGFFGYVNENGIIAAVSISL
jgi:hypothetical protein